MLLLVVLAFSENSLTDTAETLDPFLLKSKHWIVTYAINYFHFNFTDKILMFLLDRGYAGRHPNDRKVGARPGIGQGDAEEK